jgi:hypothetical protein
MPWMRLVLQLPWLWMDTACRSRITCCELLLRPLASTLDARSQNEGGLRRAVFPVHHPSFRSRLGPAVMTAKGVKGAGKRSHGCWLLAPMETTSSRSPCRSRSLAS